MKNRKILLIDDDDKIHRSMALIFNKMEPKPTILSAYSGQQGLRMLNDKHNEIDCIISDYYMADGDGLEVLDNLPEREIPVIMITGHADKDLYKKFVNQQATFVIEKPISTDEILKTVNQAFELSDNNFRNKKLIKMGERTQKVLHDIANPLCSITGYCTLYKMKNGAGKADAEFIDKAIDVIGNSSKRIDTMISVVKNNMHDDVRTISNIILFDFFVDFINTNRPILEKNNVRIKIDQISKLHTIKADTTQLYQIFDNLLSNSVDSLNHSQVENKEISIETRENGNKLEVVYLDNGNGISPLIIDKIFDNHFTTKAKGHGTGIGLFSCKDIMKDYKGDIKAKSNAEVKGGCFILEFPIN